MMELTEQTEQMEQTETDLLEETIMQVQEWLRSLRMTD